MVAIALMAVLTAAAAMFGDAILVPVTEVGSLAVGVGWLSACAAYLARRRGGSASGAESPSMAIIGCMVAVLIVLMKIVPGVPGSFSPRRVDRVHRVVSVWARLLARSPPVTGSRAPGR